MNRLAKDFYTLGIIGYPLEKSLSPRLHNAALRQCGLRGVYGLYPIPELPAGQAQMQSVMEGLREGHLDGLNVTIPHKQAVIPFLDELTPLSHQVGAVNTIYRAGSRLIGDNTDAPGFTINLRQALPGPDIPGSALVLGAGGAARAIVFSLLAQGWQITIAARHADQARRLFHSVSSGGNQPMVIELEALAEYLSTTIKQGTDRSTQNAFNKPAYPASPRLIVNATPVGMYPDNERSPWPEGVPFPDNAFVYDLVYKPPETLLVSKARSAGLQAANGLGMLVEQAALSFQRWTGMLPPIEPLRQEIIGSTTET